MGGVCGTTFNQRRQFVGLRLFVAHLDDVHVLRPPAADPFSLPVQPLTSVLQFNPNGLARHRIAVLGTITYYLHGHVLYIQDGENGVYVNTDQTTPAAPGDEVQVVGFSAVGGYSPILESAIFRVVAHHAPLEPVVVNPAKVITTDADGFKSAPYDGRLIKVRGTLIEKLRGADGQVLLLLGDKTAFRARLVGTEEQDPLASIENQSVVEVTGVCSVRSDVYHEPRTFELQMRSPSDVVVLRKAPFWNLRRSLSLLAIVFPFALAAVIWIALLRRQASMQTAVIQKNMERIQHSDEHLRMILSNVKDYAIFALDPQGNVTSWNEGAQRIMGYTPEEIIGRHYSCIFAPEDVASGQPLRHLNEAETHGSVETEGWRLRKDGSYYWANAITTALRDPSGGLRGFVRITRDLTERRKAEDAVAQAQKEQLKIKDQVLAHVSHELRTPVAAITWFTGNLQEGLLGPLTAEQLDHLEGIERNAAQLGKMVEDILNSSRVEEGKLSVEAHATNVGHLIEEILASCAASAKAKSISTHCEFPSDLPMAWADPQRTGQVIINLVNNAIKFTPEHGSVVVTAHPDEHAPEMLRIMVKDTGPGISAADQERVFSRLVQLGGTDDSGRKGLGLGLFISREFVVRQGGTISIESELGQGAAFSFTVPIASLQRVVAELLAASELAEVGLIFVDLLGADDVVEKNLLLTEIQRVIEECVRSGQDALLPGPSNSFFILTGGDQSAVDAMCLRIQQELELNSVLMDAGVDAKIATQRIAVGPVSNRDERVNRITAEVHDRVYLHSQGMEREKDGEKDIAGRR